MVDVCREICLIWTPIDKSNCKQSRKNIGSNGKVEACDSEKEKNRLPQRISKLFELENCSPPIQAARHPVTLEGIMEHIVVVLFIFQ